MSSSGEGRGASGERGLNIRRGSCTLNVCFWCLLCMGLFVFVSFLFLYFFLVLFVFVFFVLRLNKKGHFEFVFIRSYVFFVYFLLFFVVVLIKASRPLRVIIPTCNASTTSTCLF